MDFLKHFCQLSDFVYFLSDPSHSGVSKCLYKPDTYFVIHHPSIGVSNFMMELYPGIMNDDTLNYEFGYYDLKIFQNIFHILNLQF